MKVPFTKMHGCGNDYIYVNSMLYDIPDPAAASIKWSNRYKGIGSDGLVLIGKSLFLRLTSLCESSTPMAARL